MVNDGELNLFLNLVELMWTGRGSCRDGAGWLV